MFDTNTANTPWDALIPKVQQVSNLKVCFTKMSVSRRASIESSLASWPGKSVLREPGYCLKWHPKGESNNLRARTDMLSFTPVYAVRPTFNHMDTFTNMSR